MTDAAPDEDEAWPAFDEEDETWPVGDDEDAEAPANEPPATAPPAKGVSAEEDYSAFEDETAPAGDEDAEEWPAFDFDEDNTEVPEPRTRQSQSVVKGEMQKDENFTPGVAPLLEDPKETADDAGLQVKKQEEAPPEDATRAPLITKDQFQDMPAYEPTSPASEEFETVHETKNIAPIATEAAQWTDPFDHGQKKLGTPAERRKQRREKANEPCPSVLVGSQFNKECLLKAGRWVEVGRQTKANILLQNAAISKHHCKLQWRSGSSAVDLRVLDGVVHVNEKRLSNGSAATLKHGDLLRIYGKGVCFRFLIDFKNINAMLPDIRTMSNFAAATKEAQHSSRTPEEELQHKVRKMRALAEAAREKAMKYEERLTDIQTQRTLRVQKMQENLEKCKFYEKDAERLEDLLEKSRDEWMERLQKQNEMMDKVGQPLNELTSETQLQRNKLETLSREEDRRLHPERHMASLPAPAEPKVVPKKLEDTAAAKVDEASGEEEAFGDAPARGLGLLEVEDKPKDEKIDRVKPTVEVLKTAPTGADDDIADLFGDFDSEEEKEMEQEAKRQRVA